MADVQSANPQSGDIPAQAALAAFWREDGLADHDGDFAVQVLRAIAKRRLQRDLLALAGVTALAMLVLGVCAPWLGALAQVLALPAAALATAFGPVLVSLVVAASALVATAPPAALWRLLGSDPGQASPRMTKV